MTETIDPNTPLFLCPSCTEWKPKRAHCDSPTCEWVKCVACRVAVNGKGRYIKITA